MRTGMIVAVSLLAFACQRGGEDRTANTPPKPSSESAATQTSTMDPILPAETHEPSSAATPAGPTQEVHLIEYQIHMPETLPAGRVGFNIENGGKEDHGFEIEGNGVHQQSVVLKRGDTTALEVNLAPGTYTVYCPVDGHKDKGMRTTVVVK